MMPTIPFDVIAIILLMLPTESLAMFQCVCRAWHDLIRDPMFIKKHIQNRVSTDNGYLLYVPLEHPTDRAFRLLCAKTFDRVLNIELPIELMSMSFIIVGSCNGLLCLTDTNSFGTTIYVCNPFIRKYRAINYPINDVIIGSSDQSHISSTALGFGYYDVTNDYKIVRVMSPSKDGNNMDIDSGFSFETMNSKIDVYSLGEKSWKNIEVDYFPWEMFDTRSEVEVNESIHWKAIYRDSTTNNEDILVILAFHLGNEVFRQLSLPNYEGDGEDLIEYVGIVKGNLSMFLFHIEDWHEPCYLWVMKEYGVEGSWTKTHSITIDPGVVIPLVFTKNDEIIFEDGEHDFIVYRFNSKTTTILGVEDHGYLNFVTYVDSLAMLEG